MPRNFVGSCPAVCALTALKCRLPAHDGVHKSERGPFVLVAVPGQTVFPHRDALDALALAGRRESDPDDVASGRFATAKKAREAYRERHRARPAVSAHAGDATTAGNNERAADLRRST